MKKEDRGKLFVERLIKHQDGTKEKKFYAVQRFDLLIISINGAGIYGIFELIKVVAYKGSLSPNTFWYLFACFNFMYSIIINLASQWTGYKANEWECEKSECQIDEEKGEDRKVEIAFAKKKVDLYNAFTEVLNIMSGAVMLVGVGTFAAVVYFVSKLL
jgi:hypothetical protein